MIPVKRFNLPVVGSFAINTLGFSEEVGEVDFCETSPEILADFLKRVYRAGSGVLERKSLNGIRKAHGRFKWSDILKLMKRRLSELDSRPAPRRLGKARAENLRSRRKFEAAKEIFLNMKSGGQ
jgi:hypothetical protein